MQDISFSIPEILSLIGVTQCVYVLVYMAFRAGNWALAVWPSIYFLVLGLAFCADFAAGTYGQIVPFYDVWQWVFWFSGPPLSVLLVSQILRINRMPPPRALWVLALIPAAFLSAWLLATAGFGGCDGVGGCDIFGEMLHIGGLIAGVLSMAAIGLQHADLKALIQQKQSQDRYWLILAIVLVNLSFCGIVLLGLTPAVTEGQAHAIRTVIGLGFVYLAGTSLFRLYPQALLLMEAGVKRGTLTQDERAMALKIETLLNRDKVYQEPAYNRTHLARELNIPEGTVSKIINLHFGKTLPQLLNEKRIEDAKSLLTETDAGIKTVAESAGFNSLASFNRVFRDMTGMSPTEFRQNLKA